MSKAAALALLAVAALAADTIELPPELALSAERAARGQTPEGLPFYDDPSFERFCAKAASLAPGSALSAGVVRGLHEAYVHAADGDEAVLEGWLEVCKFVQVGERTFRARALSPENVPAL